MTSLACGPDLTIVPSSTSNFVDRFRTPVFDDDIEDKNPPSLAHVPPVAPAPMLPQWVCSTCEAARDLASDPRDQRRTHSQFQRASSLLAQVSKNHYPETFAEASGNLDWDAAMDEEYCSLMDLFPLPKGRKIVRCKWVYRTKYASDGSVERLKERLVAKGFSQVEGIDYNETFSDVTKMNSIHLVLSLVALHN